MTEKLLPTTVVGSYPQPDWLVKRDSIAGRTVPRIRQTDFWNVADDLLSEAQDDATVLAIRAMEQAGIDIISDGEMRRWFFVQSFHKRMTGIAPDPELRKVGLYGYDTPQRFHATEKIAVPNGLGIIEEFTYARTRTDRPLKATCPGPLTISMHIRPGDAYADRLEMAWEFASVINKELKGLVDAGADFIQLDEPSVAIIPGSVSDGVER